MDFLRPIKSGIFPNKIGPTPIPKACKLVISDSCTTVIGFPNTLTSGSSLFSFSIVEDDHTTADPVPMQLPQAGTKYFYYH